MKAESSAPSRGMRDLLPEEARLRDVVQQRIIETYSSFGFARIETPAVERIEVLRGSEGGDNEKLIFNILKRGEKLDLVGAESVGDLVDLGLRFDLTVPLARYYAHNRGHLPPAFKALQMGPVWRAERPQRGRFRQFVQCDIDVIGVPGVTAETDLLIATSAALLALGFEGFTLHINDRRGLTGLLASSGFEAGSHERVLITIDKLDKIGVEGVRAELQASDLPERAIASLMELLGGELAGADLLGKLRERLHGTVDGAVFDDLERVIGLVMGTARGRFSVVFDATLVRGMGYYTGQIFEARAAGYPFSIAGGGRYDEMIGRFLGQSVPACGFSIGFERIIALLMEQGQTLETPRERLALLVFPDAWANALAFAEQLRAKGHAVSVFDAKNKLGRQRKELAGQGFTQLCVVGARDEVPNVESLES